jgi:glycosyltransferase involved in cell wall biosynthesis
MVLVGDGPEREKLETLANQLELEPNIFFVGNQLYEAIPHYLNQAKVFVMSSAFEGLPVAMLEALGCGLPVVVPDVGDITDLAQHGVNAMLIKRASSDAYIAALEAIFSDEPLYLQLVEGALNTRQWLMENYTLEKASADFKRILLDCKP